MKPASWPPAKPPGRPRARGEVAPGRQGLARSPHRTRPPGWPLDRPAGPDLDRPAGQPVPTSTAEPACHARGFEGADLAAPSRSRPPTASPARLATSTATRTWLALGIEPPAVLDGQERRSAGQVDGAAPPPPGWHPRVNRNRSETSPRSTHHILVFQNQSDTEVVPARPMAIWPLDRLDYIRETFRWKTERTSWAVMIEGDLPGSRGAGEPCRAGSPSRGGVPPGDRNIRG